MSDISKATILGHCRDGAVEALALEFEKLAGHSDASVLEVLVAAVTFTLMAAESIPNHKQRAAMLAALIDSSLQ